MYGNTACSKITKIKPNTFNFLHIKSPHTVFYVQGVVIMYVLLYVQSDMVKRWNQVWLVWRLAIDFETFCNDIDIRQWLTFSGR